MDQDELARRQKLHLPSNDDNAKFNKKDENRSSGFQTSYYEMEDSEDEKEKLANVDGGGTRTPERRTKERR